MQLFRFSIGTDAYGRSFSKTESGAKSAPTPNVPGDD